MGKNNLSQLARKLADGNTNDAICSDPDCGGLSLGGTQTCLRCGKPRKYEPPAKMGEKAAPMLLNNGPKLCNNPICGNIIEGVDVNCNDCGWHRDHQPTNTAEKRMTVVHDVDSSGIGILPPKKSKDPDTKETLRMRKAFSIIKKRGYRAWSLCRRVGLPYVPTPSLNADVKVWAAFLNKMESALEEHRIKKKLEDEQKAKTKAEAFSESSKIGDDEFDRLLRTDPHAALVQLCPGYQYEYSDDGQHVIMDNNHKLLCAADDWSEATQGAAFALLIQRKIDVIEKSKVLPPSAPRVDGGASGSKDADERKATIEVNGKQVLINVPKTTNRSDALDDDKTESENSWDFWD